jgi:hypothetical protein
MTGERLIALRLALDLEQPWFASLLGLHATKLQSWEASEEISLHPLQAHILSLLEVQVKLLGPRAPELGRRILKGILMFGPPYGLLVLLQSHYLGYADFASIDDSKPGRRV